MQLSVVLMGGARRVTLAEQIRQVSNANGLATTFISIERDNGFYPISEIARTVAGPPFGSPHFPGFLEGILTEVAHPLLIACMDTAVPALASLVGRKFGGSTIVGPSPAGAEIALDKGATSDFCHAYGIAHPNRLAGLDSSAATKVIAKPLRGFGGKGIVVANNAQDLAQDIFLTHIVQEFIEGPETTHDVYVTQTNDVDITSRDRLAVIDGEVDHCFVRRPSIRERDLIQRICGTGLFRGPITVQTIRAKDQVYLIEINARLGGGVTASVAAGASIIENLLADVTGLTFSKREFRPLEMKRARRDFYRYLD